jgi:membrane protein YqaA with SNARE-associated domain
MVTEKLKQKRWLKMALYLVILVGLSFGFIYLFEYLMAYFNISVERFTTTAYLVVFVISLVSNASIIVPVPIFIAIMITAAEHWNPALIALAASVAGTLGEITGYYAGYLGKRIIHLENAPGYEKLVGWMKRYGTRAIFLLSLQPILPFDIAGLISGASRVPLWKFLLACWGGKLPKYLLGCYIGPAFLNILPPLPLPF